MKNFKEWIWKAFNISILKRNRYNWVDYLRGIVILLVVYHHTYLGIERSGIEVPESVGDANMVFYSFRMPLFFIISGIFTSITLSVKPINKLIWSKYDKILYPYFIWAFLQITLQIILSNFTNSERDFGDYLYILYQPKQLDQFWYLPALFNSTLVFILIKTKLNPKFSVDLMIGLVLYFAAPFLNDISMMSNWMRFYLFFVLGDKVSNHIFRQSVQEQLKRPLTILLFIPLFIVAQIFYLDNNVGAKAMESTIQTFEGDYNLYLLNEVNFLFTSLIGCTTLIIISFLLEKWGKLSFLRVLGYHSLYIYITHVIVVGFTRALLVRVFHIDNYLVILLVAIAFGVVLPVIFYNLAGKNYLWFLFTSRRKDKQAVVYTQSTKPVEKLAAQTNE